MVAMDVVFVSTNMSALAKHSLADIVFTSGSQSYLPLLLSSLVMLLVL
jgi:hypothetical protein